jgi:integrase
VYKRSPLEKRLRQRNGNPTYYFWAYDWRGKRYEATTHQCDWKAALNYARDEERKRASKPEEATEVVTVTLEQAFEALKARDVRVASKPNTVRFHADRFAHLTRLLKSVPDLKGLEAYTDKRLAERASRGTIEKEHRVLRLALRCAGAPYEHLKVEGFVDPSDFYEPGDVWLEKAEYVQALLAELVPSRRDDVLVCTNLGLRRRELLTITAQRVDLKKKTLVVDELDEVTLKTNGSTRTLPLNDAMVALFARQMVGVARDQPLFTEWGSGNRDLQAAWKRARAKLGETEDPLPTSLCFNDLRRTFCSLLKNAGATFEECAELLGHEDITMVRQVYGKSSASKLRGVVALLPVMV